MIVVHTQDPHGLVDNINEAIKNGRIVTWSFDSEGDYTHNLDQWKEKAWLRCVFDVTDSTLLRIVIIEPKMQKLTKAVYAVYHGRFAELLLAHFDNEITDLSITPLLSQFDMYSRES